ncbi:MAG: hypothetical protein QGH39_09300 [Candidatus Thermoplasmatota archaeon]|jgi:hypothetical protein|nr:hypothetical protein [Candidatus Thermoplasmatota archaeon]|tara:strand:- start:283 stop:1038 length:756 start_codon:yes stop_codon:yes gene_type:complete
MSKLRSRLLKKYGIIALIMLSHLGCVKSTEEAESSEKYNFGELSALAHGKTDKSMEYHGFTEIYEHIFFPLKDLRIKIFEIGIAKGGSLFLWQDYFTNATIYGIDIYEKSVKGRRIKTFIADQTDRNQLQSFIDKYGSDYAIILDDGGHQMEMQQISFGFLFRHVKPGGYYIIEDVHTSLPNYYPSYAPKDQENSTLRMINNFIENSVIKSKYLKPEEIEYLNNNIEYCNLFFRNNGPHSITCIFKKSLND